MLGVYNKGRLLQYVGHTGTGFSEALLKDLSIPPTLGLATHEAVGSCSCMPLPGAVLESFRSSLWPGTMPSCTTFQAERRPTSNFQSFTPARRTLRRMP